MGLGTRVRPRWLVIAGSQDMLAGFGGVGRSDMLPPGEPRDGRAGSGVGGLLTSRGRLTGGKQRLQGKTMERRAEDDEGDPQDFPRTPSTRVCSVKATGRSECPAVKQGEIPSEETSTLQKGWSRHSAGVSICCVPGPDLSRHCDEECV